MSEFKIKVDVDDLDLRSSKGFLFKVLPESILSWFTEYDRSSEDFLIEELGILDRKIEEFNNNVENKTRFESYLTSNEIEHLERKAEEILNLIDKLASTTWSFQIDDYLVQSFEEMKTDFQATIASLENYNEDFVEKEIERYDYMFQRGEYSLNREQKKAVIRNDNYNQVIAGAGAGKTLVLIYRIAYLVEKGVNPDDIVAFSFTNKVADEIENRLSENFDIEDVEVTTFHSFGKNKISGNPEFLEFSKEEFVNTQLEAASPNGKLGRHYRSFLALKDADFVSADEFEKEKEYIKARRERDYETLKGEQVKSRDEKAIADFLFTHNVDYIYEKRVKWADTAEDKGPYEPDFYLPEYDIYIEHWGVDENGEVAEWFTKSSQEYLEQRDWKRREFKDKNKELVETFHYEYRNDNLEQRLKDRLKEYSVTFEPLSLDEIAARTVDNEQDKIVKYLGDFIDLARSLNKDHIDVEEDLQGLDMKKYHYGRCGQILLKRYEEKKRERNEIDFADMIHRAVEEMKKRNIDYSNRYDQVLVDEFQDLSKGKIEMVKLLTGEDGANLFCVGDDWQSIYGFTGAKVEYFVDFEGRFGEATKTRLVRNYRSTEDIVETGNTLIDNNPNQINKQLKAVRSESLQPRLHSINGEGRRYATNVAKHTVRIAKKYAREGSDPEDIMILSRLYDATHITTKIETKLEEEGIENVEVLSAHRAKGREAKHVIIVNTTEEHAGFSPVNEGSKLNDIIRDHEVNTEAEERRLFYVAITRAEDTVDILTKTGEESSYLPEIKEEIIALNTVADPGEIESRVNLRATVNKLREGNNEKMKYWGVLKDSTGTRVFTAWESDSTPDLEFKKKYIFRNLKVTEYEGEKQLQVTEETEIEEL